MSRKSLATRRKPSSRKEHTGLHARDFRRLGLSTDEVRIEVIRSRLTKQARAILAHSGKWIPKRLDDQLSAIVSTGYRLLDPRFRTSVRERVFLAYPLERLEEEIPEVESLVEKIDASIAHYDAPNCHTDGTELQDGLSDSNFICAEVVEFVELATSVAPISAQANSLQCNRELVRLLREQEAEEKAERSVLSKMRKWLTLSSIALALVSATAWSLRYRSSQSSVAVESQPDSKQAKQILAEQNLAEQTMSPTIAVEHSSAGIADQLAVAPLNSDQATIAINSLDAIIPPITSSVILENDFASTTANEVDPQASEFNPSITSAADVSIPFTPGPEIPAPSHDIVANDGKNEGDGDAIEVPEERFGFVVSKATIRESRNRLARVLKLLQEVKLDQQSRLDRLSDLLNESPEGSADRLAILEASAKENVKVHGLERGLAVCDRIEQEYPKYGWQARYDLYKSHYLSGKSVEDHGKMAELGLKLSEHALAADEVAMATQLIRLTIGVANRSRDQRILSLALRLQQNIQTARQLSRAS